MGFQRLKELKSADFQCAYCGTMNTTGTIWDENVYEYSITTDCCIHGKTLMQTWPKETKEAYIALIKDDMKLIRERLKDIDYFLKKLKNDR